MCIALVLDRTGNTALCILAALLHELAHIIAIKMLNVNAPVKVSLTPLDYRIIDLSAEKRPYLEDIFISLMGPFLNIALFVTFYYGLGYPAFAYANLCIGVFNLLPVHSLDGGKAVLSVLLRYFSVSKAQRILNILSAVFVVPIVLLGFYVLYTTGYNFSLILIGAYLVTLIIFGKE